MRNLSLCVALSTIWVTALSPLRAVEIEAHRGASYDAPENTLASAKLAWENRADVVEMDIRLTKDGELVLLHDDNTKRTTGVPGNVEDMTLEEVRALDAGSWKDSKYAGEKIPTLDEILATIPDGKKVFVELKSGEKLVNAVKASVDRSGKKPGQIVFIAADNDALVAAKKIMPDHKMIWIRNYHLDDTGKPTQTIEQVIETAKSLGLDGVDLKVAWPIDAALVKKVKDAGLSLHVWTVDDPAVAKALVAAGVDGITTNRAGWLREQLGGDSPLPTAKAAEEPPADGDLTSVGGRKEAYTKQFPPIVPKVPVTSLDAPAGTWTLAVLPDTQSYVQRYPEAFVRQTEWLAANKERQNIIFVATEGDVTNDNNPEQWQRARAAMDKLNAAKLPYFLTTGNHDLGEGGNCATRTTLMNDYFEESDYASSSAHGLFEPGRVENSWHEFATPAGKYLILGLEFAPRDAVLEWAEKVISEHADCKVIVATHAYLYTDNTRYDWDNKKREQNGSPRGYGVGKEAGSNDGEDIWEKLISKHANILFVLSGHATDKGSGYLASKAADGHTVHQILANYQGGVKPPRGYGGGSYLRLMQFLPDGKTVRVRTYSPLYDLWQTDPDQQFDLKLD